MTAAWGEVDHVIIFCDVGAPEADVLLARGLHEGPGNTHPGQGTANRRFFFPNVYLELLWVDHPAEAQSEAGPARSTSRAATPRATPSRNPSSSGFRSPVYSGATQLLIDIVDAVPTELPITLGYPSTQLMSAE